MSESYIPNRKRYATVFHEVEDEWHAYMLNNFGHAEATRVTCLGVEMTAMLHPLNNWMAVIRAAYRKRLDRVAYAVCAHEDGRMDQSDMKAARSALALSLGMVERAKAVDAKTVVINASPFTVEPIPVEASA